MALPFIAIYGMGRFGRALAGALDARKLPLVRVGGRGEAPPDWNTLYARGPAAFLHGLEPGTLVMLALPDDALPGAATEFAALAGAAGLMFVHPSGSRGTEALAPLEAAGARTGVFHILQSFPRQDGSGLIAGSYGSVGGQVIPDLLELAGALDVAVVQLKDEQRIAYHAAAVLASNALVALLDVGRGILVQAGIPEETAARMLTPLARGTLTNVETTGIEQALTGPVVRGDVGTIARHLAALTGPAREAYVATMRAAADLAERSGRLKDPDLAAIRELLESA
ncbi:MAG: DUF2520 domain-containing protein [Planctomycetes bacterium]|nr:DUF2520 domain-containing protein [Planctomycetota bacterium]